MSDGAAEVGRSTNAQCTLQIMEARRGWVNQREELPVERRYNFRRLLQSRTFLDEAHGGRDSRAPL
jgi:hypothetical protein